MTVTVGLTMALVLIALLVLGVPICISIAISSVIAGAQALDFNMMLQTGAQRTFSGISVFSSAYLLGHLGLHLNRDPILHSGR